MSQLTIKERTSKLDAITASYKAQLAETTENDRFQRALITAEAMNALSEALTPEILTPILNLQGSRLGFRTDKDKSGGYDVATIKTAIMEAILIGVHPIGNEFNVIAGNCYVTKEGLTRLLRNYRGLTELRLKLGVPRMAGGGAIVDCSATWKLNGQPDQIECEIPIKVNNGMGADSILGKAERKLKSRIYAQLTGSDIGDGEVEETARNVTPEVKPAQQNTTAGEPEKSAVSRLTEKIQQEGISMAKFRDWAKSKGMSPTNEVNAEAFLARWDKIPVAELKGDEA